MDESFQRDLGLRAGDWVEVRTKEEILGTLDENGRLDGLPFMPEMLEFCGKRFRVYKSAHKTCNTIDKIGPSGRRMENAVHLEGLRCDGRAHGGCQAGCLMFWKHAWLRHAPDEHGRVRRTPRRGASVRRGDACAETTLTDRTVAARSDDPCAAVRYSCQITELKRATRPLPEWNLRQYVQDFRSRNIGFREYIGSLFLWLFRKTSRLGAYSLQRRIYDKLQACAGGIPYPEDAERGIQSGKTPTARLGVEPGDLVRTKSYEEILKTLDRNSKNRGLWFDIEMVPFCGREARVLRRVDRILNEATGEMMHFKNPCIVLEGFFCSGRFSAERYFCPRSIYSYWREIWLDRVERPEPEPGGHGSPLQVQRSGT